MSAHVNGTETLGSRFDISLASGLVSGRYLPGDSIKALVLEVRPDLLLLRFPDGALVEALLQASLDVKTGELLKLVVKDVSEGRVLARADRVIPSQPEGNRQAVIALLKAGIQPSDENIAFAKRLESLGFPMRKEYLQKAFALLEAQEDITAEKAALLVLNKIEAESQIISTLEKVQSQGYKLHSQLEELNKALLEIEEPHLFEFLKDISGGEIKKAGPDNVSGPQAAEIPVMAEEGPQLQAGTGLVEGEGINQAAGDTGPTGGEAVRQAAGSTEPMGSGAAGQAAGDGSPVEEAVRQAVADTDLVESEALRQVIGNADPVGREAVGQAAASTGPVEREVIRQAIEHAITAEKTGSGKAAFETADKAYEALKSQEPDGLFEDLYLKSLEEALSKEEVREKVQNLGPEMAKRLGLLKRAAALLDTPLAERVNRLVDFLELSLKAINRLRDPFIYLQLPVKNGEHSSTLELYMLGRRLRKKQSDPDRVTLLISLDTLNLGAVESLVEIAGKKLTINMRARDEKAVEFLKRHRHVLSKALSERGFTLAGMWFKAAGEKVTLLKALEVFGETVPGKGGVVDCRI